MRRKLQRPSLEIIARNYRPPAVARGARTRPGRGKLWDLVECPPPPRASTTLEYDADFLAWQAAGRLFDGIE